MDDIEILRTPRTHRTEHGPAVWTDVQIMARSGIIAVFRPSEEAIEAGEADLDVEHLTREAEALVGDLRRIRRAFRSALPAPDPPAVLRPFFLRVEPGDGPAGLRPRLAHAGWVLATALVVGVAGGTALEEGSLLHLTSLVLSVALMGYAFLGAWTHDQYRSEFFRTARLPVAIRPAGEGTQPEAREPGGFEAPYQLHPEILVRAEGAGYRLVPRVAVRDAGGRLFEVLEPFREPGASSAGADPEVQAAVLLRRARELADRLEQEERDAERVARPR